MLYWRISSQTSNEQKYCKMMCLRKWVSCFDMKTVTVTSCLYTRFHLFYLCHLAIRLTQLRCLTIYSLSLFPLRVVCLHQYIYFSTSFENAHENRGGGICRFKFEDIFSLSVIHMCQHLAYLPGVWVGLRCGVCVAQWGSHWAPTGPSSPAVAGRWGPGCLPSAQDCPGWWDSPLLAPSSSTPREELQPERMSLKTFKGRQWWQGYKLALHMGDWFFCEAEEKSESIE